jgi:hypothetical protein
MVSIQFLSVMNSHSVFPLAGAIEENPSANCFHKMLTWTARVCIPHTMAFVLLVNRTSGEQFPSPLTALLAAFSVSLITEVVTEEQLTDPLRECRGLSCEHRKCKIYYYMRKF